MNHNKICFVILLFALLLYPIVPWAAEVYMWVDEKGVKHITDQPPEKPAKIIEKETYRRDSPEEIRKYEQSRKIQQQLSELESERQSRINRFNEAMEKSAQQQKQNRREYEIERAKKDLEHETKYQIRYEEKRRNANSKWETDLYDDLKKQQDKDVNDKRRKLLELENSR